MMLTASLKIWHILPKTQASNHYEKSIDVVPDPATENHLTKLHDNWQVAVNDCKRTPKRDANRDMKMMVFTEAHALLLRPSWMIVQPEQKRISLKHISMLDHKHHML